MSSPLPVSAPLAERDLIRRRDWRGLIRYGAIFFVLEKLAAVLGVLTLAAAPSEAAVARVRLLLAELYGAASKVGIRTADAAVEVVVEVPYELA